MSRRPLVVPLVVLLGLALGALGASLRARPAAPASPSAGGGPRPAPAQVVALGEGRALRVLASRTEPLQLEQVSAGGGGPTPGWRWAGTPGRLEWSRRGPLLVGKGTRHLELFDVERGHLAAVPSVSTWCFAPGGVAAVVSSTREAAQVALVASDGRTRWTARLPGARGARLEATGARVVAWGRSRAWALALEDGAVTDLGALDAVVGVVPADEVLLALRAGEVVARPLGLPASDRPIALTGGEPLLDGTRFEPPRPPGTSPRLVGRHAGRWIVAYATEPASEEATGALWRTPATQHLAAVDAATGQVAWRRTLGSLEVSAEPACGDELAADLLVVGWTEDEEHERTFTLASVSLADGAERWRTTWPGRGYPSEPALLRRGAATYLFAAGLDFHGLLARFAGGRLTGGLLGGATRSLQLQAIDEDGVWTADRGGQVRRLALGDALAGVVARLELPPGAR